MLFSRRLVLQNKRLCLPLAIKCLTVSPHLGDDWIVNQIRLAALWLRFGGLARPQSRLQLLRRIHRRPGVRMLHRPRLHLIEKTPRIILCFHRKTLFHGFEFQQNWFSLHIQFLPSIAAACKPRATAARAAPPPDAAAAKFPRWPDVSYSTSEDNPPDDLWRRPNAPHPPSPLTATHRLTKTLPSIHPPSACDAAPSTCSKPPAVAGSISRRPPPPHAILPPKSRTQKMDGATATNPSSKRATAAPPCAPEAAPPDNSPRSSRCRLIPLFIEPRHRLSARGFFRSNAHLQHFTFSIGCFLVNSLRRL